MEEESPVTGFARPREVRHGRTPPVNTFTGEDLAVRLDDWLPGLERVAHWNGWTSEERTIQLAGHLRGHAEAEWNLLGVDNTSDFVTAVHNLRERLDPCSKVLAGQDFRRTMQGGGETVADYVCRLEKAFRVAFESDGLGQKTKEGMLYGQLPEGLRLGITRSPSVSGALNYKGLCMAAKHEEQRQAELRKRQEYEKSHNRSQSRSRLDGGISNRPSRQNVNNSQLGGSALPGGNMTSRRCYLCNQVGYLAKNCKTGNREQESKGHSGQN